MTSADLTVEDLRFSHDLPEALSGSNLSKLLPDRQPRFGGAFLLMRRLWVWPIRENANGLRWRIRNVPVYASLAYVCSATAAGRVN
jgi:hypothetical protein